MNETLFNREKCLQRNRVAALRYGIDTAHVNFLSDGGGSQSVEYRNYGGRMPASDEEALAMINALLPEGAEPLALSEVYVHYVEAANNNFIEDRYGFISRNTLRNVARDGAAGAAFMNSHRTGGLSTDGEFPFGKTFAGQYQEGRDAEDRPLQRAMLGFYMLRALRPNGDAGPSTDDLDRKIRGGTLFDVSVGLFGGSRICDVCGDDLIDSDCPHIPGTLYAMDEDEIEAQKARGVPDGKASYTIEGARLGEVSGVFDGAVRGAGFRKAARLAPKLSGANLKLAREVYGGLGTKEGSEMDESLFERLSEAVAEGFRRVFGGKQPRPAGEAAEEPAEATLKKKQEEAGMAEQKNDGVDVEQLRRDSEELAALKKQQREDAAEQFSKDAVAKHRTLLPFGADKLKGLFAQLSEDDADRPLATGSRVEQLQALFAALPGHKLTRELAASELPEGAVVLDNDSDPEQTQAKKAREKAREWKSGQQVA